ncbi:SURF1 family protein [Sphingomonas insulae]|uniref:SURF1-like protein n=2 Tax=Sphingomonas insulae TaxID=424800 RepID=A0ABN1HWF2_9SPHN|nr:SURF1 family protein [Sphingomonas insulae]
MRRRAIVTGLLVATIVLLAALGVWQLQRRTWKLALIAQTERQLHQPPIAPPGPARWQTISAGAAYTPIIATGRYRTGADTYVQAVTELGGGFWVMTPFNTANGITVLVNRGFVPGDHRGGVAPSPASRTVRGLLRLSEPGGGFLRYNDPAAARWYSRDVAAIAAAKHVGPVAPYFIDASEPRTGWPRGGLTVVRFHNSHLIYALTWFGLALLVAIMTWRARR